MPNPAETIPLPPMRIETDQVCDRLRRRAQRVEFALAALVLVLAFLLGSFAVRNADFWLHLATGRLIAACQYQFGVDPFASTTEGLRWVNHSWLFNWLLYECYRLLGDGLVILKGLLIALLALVLMSIRRREKGVWLPALCTALALLVAGPRLLLQPMLVSLLFLAATLWLLTQGNRRREWLLVPLFAVWVNLDVWFLLGPAIVAVFAVAEWSVNQRFRQLMGLLAAGIAACLLNPHHVYAFQLPMELSPAVLTSPLLDDVRFERLLESPWRLGRYKLFSVGLNPAGLAYFVLLGLGVISFVRCRAALHDWRLPLWLLFALLGAWQLRLVPLFAVVAGPITALNFQDATSLAVARSLTIVEFQLRRGLFLRVCTVLLGFWLAALAWPGWLHATPHELRRVDWTIRPDPGLRLTAETLREWYDSGRLPHGTRLFTSHPDVGAYLAWFCPAARGTIDPRLTLFTPSADQFIDVSTTLNPALGKSRADEKKHAADLMAYSVFVYYDPDLQRCAEIFAGPVLERPEDWPLLFVGGRTIIVGFRQGAGPKPDIDALALDLTRQAYRTTSALRDESVFITPRTPWQRYLQSSVSRSADADTAALYQHYYDAKAMRLQSGLDGDPAAVLFADMIGHAAGKQVLVGVMDITLRLRLGRAGFFMPFIDPGPPEAVVLALRSARRAVAHVPNDPTGWLRLAQAQLSLKLMPRERAWAADMPMLALVRHVQIATALENALRLNPDLVLAHRLLANLYAEREFLDLALEHQRKEVEFTRATGPAPGERAEDWKTRNEEADKRLLALEKAVQERLNQYVIQAGHLGSKPLEQAQTAMTLGLARKALDDVLLKSDVRLFGRQGAQLQFYLLLMTGRVDRARDELAQLEQDNAQDQLDFLTVPALQRPDYPSEYRLPAFDWFTTLLASATGDYGRADRALRAIDERTRADAADDLAKIRTRLATLLTAEVGAFALPEIFVYQVRLRDNRIAFERLLQGMELVKLQRADVLAVAGLLALERGDIDGARQHFTQSLDLARNDQGRVRNFAGRGAAEVMLDRLR